MRGITVPIFSSASAGAVSFVALFNDGRSHPATFNANDRSKIALYFLLLCGIISNGEVFKFCVGFCFLLSHLTVFANPCADFPCASTWICEIASSFNADEWGPLVTDAYISSGVQSRPTDTRHPARTYCSNKFAARCRLALHIRKTRPRNFPRMTPSDPVNSSSNRRWSSANALADLFFH